MSNTRTASDSPKVFNLDVVEAEARREPFRFILGGDRFEVPHMQDMDAYGVIEIAEKGDDLRGIADSLKAGLGGDWDRFRAKKLTIGGLEALFREWGRHSGVDQGESQASASS